MQKGEAQTKGKCTPIKLSPYPKGEKTLLRANRWKGKETNNLVLPQRKGKKTLTKR